MAIFPAYLATSFINKFCSPPVNRYSPFPDNRSPAQQDGLVDANKKCVTLRSARAYSSSSGSLLSSGFFPSNRSATAHASRRERGEDREGVGVKRERRREIEKGNSWSDEKASASYRKAINEYGRLCVSIPTERFFFFFFSSPASRSPPCGNNADGRKRDPAVGGCKMLGASELKRRKRRAVPGACRAPGAGCNITSHTQPPR